MRKKKRSRASDRGGGSNAGPSTTSNEEDGAVKSLVDAFGSVSVEEAKAAFREASGDLDEAAKMLLERSAIESGDDQSTTCSSSSGNGSTSSSLGMPELFSGVSAAQNGLARQKGKPKPMRVVATSGTVATMLGKDYVRPVPKRTRSKSKGVITETHNREDAEQFLCSMLGEECELNMAVVRDVLCQCGYDVEKALNILLELAAPLSQKVKISDSASNLEDDARFLLKPCDGITDRTSESTSHTSEGELTESIWGTGPPYRNQDKVHLGFEAPPPSGKEKSPVDLPQMVLESLFNMATTKGAEHEPNTMNWRNVVRKMASLGQTVESPASDAETKEHIDAKGDEYHVFRQAAKEHWESMRSYYNKAATAFSNGERQYAAYLSEQGRSQNRMAKEAEMKASQDIFVARNKKIENVITIDLHGQHVKQAMRVLKLHLLFGAYVRSVSSFRVITGCGSHGVGKSKLKNSVINLLEGENIAWSEENRGTLFIRLNGQRNFGFLDADSDSE